MTQLSPENLVRLKENIKEWGEALGFQQVGIANIDLAEHEPLLQKWLDKGYHGQMNFMQAHGMMRARPDELLPGTLRVISVRMDYLPTDAEFAQNLRDKKAGYISRYALGRDYHKVMRKRLKQLGDKIKQHCASLQFRPFVDSAPVLEHAIAQNAGIGWTGKHSLTLNKEAGSWFFLGELFIDIPLPIDQPETDHCGSCSACITICPTQAIVEPYVVDARRCISYLSIELDGEIPVEFRHLMGNRIYGCDDCQLICPWNRFAQITKEDDFQTREKLKHVSLLELVDWDEQTFLNNTQGTAIRRIGFQRWQRNIMVALGNAPFDIKIIDTLKALRPTVSELVAIHLDWAVKQQLSKSDLLSTNLNVDRQNQRLIRSVEKGLPRDA